jgi:parallel beta-helix repeat protein
LNSSKPVLTVNSGGSGSIITGFIITSGTGLSSSGVRLNSATNCTIQSNSITGNRNGIYLSGLSTNNYIFNNYIQNSTLYGISLSSRNNTITGNNISNNNNGIMIDSHYNLISRNTLSNNRVYGIYMDGADNTYLYENTISYNNYGVYFFECTFEMHFNQIFGNQYGVYSDLGGCLNATNNWWGTNNPTNTSTNSPADIVIYDGVVTYDPWLVLNMTGSVIHVTKNSSSSSQITVDLTHNNHGDDTSGSGTIPDGLPVNFTATVPASITSGATIKRGKATVILTSSTSSGATIVTATTYNQTFSKSFHKSFSTIQSAIEDTLTVNGDVILVENGTYTENIVVDKRLGIFSEGNVTVQALNPSIPVFTLTGGGNSSVINGFHIIGASGSSGVYLSSASDCVIDSNSIEWNTNGVYLEDSTGNLITNNFIDHNLEGLYFDNSSHNTITSNYITDNEQGIFIPAECMEYFESISINNTISKNTIENNNYGICLMGDWTGINSLGRSFNDTSITENTIIGNDYGVYVSSTAFNMHFNRISGNNVCGLWLETDAFLDLENNWWGTNNPVSDHNTYNPSEIYDIFYNGGYLYYSNELLPAFAQWLVLTLNTSSVNSGGNASVTADLTHNNVGNDTSSDGHIPDDVPVTFTTNQGSVISPVYTFNGKATTILNLGTLQSVTVNVSASVDNQTVYKQTTLAPGVVVLNITSTVLDLSNPYYELVGYQNITQTKVFNWYRLAVILSVPSNLNVNALKNYVSRTYGDTKVIDCAIPPENVVKYLIYEHLYTDWWSEEALYEFVYYWGLSNDDFHYIQQNYLSLDVVNYLYGYMWDDLGNSTVQQPPSNDMDDTTWYNRIWGAGNAPYVRFPLMLPYVPSNWVLTTTTSIPIYHETYSPLNITCEIPLNNSVSWVSIMWKDTKNSTGLFSGQLDVIVDGVVVQSVNYVNEYYLISQNYFSAEVFEAILLVNQVFPSYAYDNDPAALAVWDMYQGIFTPEEYNFLRNYRLLFIDYLNINLAYPGDSAQTIIVSSADNATENITLNFSGNPIQRTSLITYLNGLFGGPAGYEGVKSLLLPLR